MRFGLRRKGDFRSGLAQRRELLPSGGRDWELHFECRQFVLPHLCGELLRLWQLIYMGSDDFVGRMKAQAEPARMATPAIPKAQRSAAPRIWPDHLEGCGGDRNAAHPPFCAAYRAGRFRMPNMVSLAGLSVSEDA